MQENSPLFPRITKRQLKLLSILDNSEAPLCVWMLQGGSIRLPLLPLAKRLLPLGRKKTGPSTGNAGGGRPENLRRCTCSKLKQCFRSLFRQVVRNFKKCVLICCFYVVQPLLWDTVLEKFFIIHTGKKSRLCRCGHGGFDVMRMNDFLDPFSNLYKLSGSSFGMCLKATPFGPFVRCVVMIYVAEQ